MVFSCVQFFTVVKGNGSWVRNLPVMNKWNLKNQFQLMKAGNKNFMTSFLTRWYVGIALYRYNFADIL